LKKRRQGAILAPIFQKAPEENVPNMTVQTWTIITFLTNWLNLNNPMVAGGAPPSVLASIDRVGTFVARGEIDLSDASSNRIRFAA